MYLTGTQYNFKDRLHQLPTSTGELQTFINEKAIYSVTPLISGAWTREEIKKRIIFNWRV